MAYDAWLALKAFFDSPSPGQDRIENLSTQIHLLFLFSSTLNRIVRPEPRGARAGKQSLGQYLPQAYFACRELLRRSEACAELDELIEKLISSFAEKAPEVQRYWTAAQKQPESYRDQMAAVCLVYRAFYGAWELYNIQGLVAPQEAFRRYLYGKRAHQLGHAAKALNSTLGKDLLMDKWIWLYLDAQTGFAARAYRLIPAPPLRRSAQIH
jgi:hypothetical protein